MSGGGGGDGPNLAAQQQAMNHGKAGPQGATSLENFLGSKGMEEVRKFAGMLDKHMKDIAGGSNSEGGSSTSGAAGADHGHGPAAAGPIATNTSAQQSMSELMGGNKTPSFSERVSSKDDGGGRGV